MVVAMAMGIKVVDMAKEIQAALSKMLWKIMVCLWSQNECMIFLKSPFLARYKRQMKATAEWVNQMVIKGEILWLENPTKKLVSAMPKAANKARNTPFSRLFLRML